MALARAGQGQVVGVRGEAGIGKSRLVSEAMKLAQPKELQIYQGKCLSYTTNTPYSGLANNLARTV